MSTNFYPMGRLSRRLLVGSSLAGAASLPLGSMHTGSASTFTATSDSLRMTQTPVASPGTWRMWYLSSSDELRPDAPGEPTQEEIDELIKLQAARTAESEAGIARWGTGHPLFAWCTLAGELSAEFKIAGMPQARFMALVHTAMHDAVIATWDAQLAFERPSPGATSSEITPLTNVDSSLPSFPSQHAAIAGAASVILAALLPDAAPGRLDTLATEAAESRLMAGAAFRSDIKAGLDIGRAVGELAVARALDDKGTAEWDPATMPTGPGYWQPTPPGFVETALNPLAGSWKTWVMTSGDQFRPGPPPEYDSPAWRSELNTVRTIVANRSLVQSSTAVWWAGTSLAVLFNTWTKELIAKGGVDLPHAARVLADMHVAAADALIAVWDGKYTWWTSRPITDDPSITTAVPTPPYPGYPSGFSAYIGALSCVVGHYFPAAADELASRAWEGTASRAWAGIHYVIDDDIGLAMGRQVGRLVYSLSDTSEM